MEFWRAPQGHFRCDAELVPGKEREWHGKRRTRAGGAAGSGNGLLNKTLNWLEGAARRGSALSGEVERISATVEQSRREEELAAKLAAAEREMAELKAAATPLVVELAAQDRPASTTEMLAKHGIGDGPVDVRTLDAALSGLSLEQRIAVKTQLLRAGAIA